MNPHLILLTLLFVFHSLFTLEKSNATTPNNTLQHQLTHLAYYQTQERDSLINDEKTLAELLSEARIQKNNNAIWLISNAITVVLRERGAIKEAFSITDECIQKAKKENNTIHLIVAYNNYAILCRRVDRLTDASTFHLQALKLAESNNAKSDWLIPKSKCVSLNGLGNISLSLGQNKDAMRYFKAAILIEKQLGSNVGIAINHANIGAVYESLQMTDSALLHYNLSMQFNQKSNCAKGIAICHVSIGNLLIKEGDFNRAIEHFKLSIEISDSIGDHYHWLYGAHSYISALSDIKNYTLAEKLSKQSIIKAKNENIWYYLSEAYLSLANIYEKQYDNTKALKYIKLGQACKDTIEAKSNFSKINDLQLKYESEKKEQQIELLRTKEKNYSFVRNILIVLLIILTLLLFSLWKLARFRKRDNIQKEELLLREKLVNSMRQEKHNSEIELKEQELTLLANQLATKNEMLNDLKTVLSSKGYSSDIITQFNNELTNEKYWEVFYLKFENAHPQFFSRLRQTFPEITSKDERLCAYLRINMTSKEIAQILNVTVAAVDKSRNRLRKKLALPAEVNLTEFMQNIS